MKNKVNYLRPGLIMLVLTCSLSGCQTIKEIVQRFEEQSRHRVVLAPGSTGKHYAQIRNGAPFDVFFAADARRPILLEKEGLALPGSRFTYALGRLVLWSPDAGKVDPAGMVLDTMSYRHLAIANPKLAPYGKAAREIIEKRGLWQTLQNKLVRGENIGQTFHFVKTGNAELGFVAWSQILRPGKLTTGSWWVPPQALYSPIEQQAVSLNDNEQTRDFLAFIRGDEGRTIIKSFGYGPD